MELTSGVVIVIVVLVIGVGFLLARLGGREAGAPVDRPAIPPSSGRPEIGLTKESLALATWLLDQASKQTGASLAGDPLAVQRLAEAAQKALTELQTQDSTTVNLPFLTADASGPKHFEVRVSRSTLNAPRTP
jgi:molecular chaperone DnaK (HSP70)